MGLSCGARCLKLCLLVFNVFFLLCGLICVAIGAWLSLDKYAVDSLADATRHVQGYEQDVGLRDLANKPGAVRQIAWVLIVGGCLVIAVAFLGCCGAAKQWRPLLCCYASCLMVILATEIAAAIYAAMHSHMFEEDFRLILRTSLKHYNGTDGGRTVSAGGQRNEDLVKAAWDRLMVEKKCCGIDSRLGEFNESGWYLSSRRQHPFPAACCPPRGDGQLADFCPTISRRGEGCYGKIRASMERLGSHFQIVSFIIFFIALVQVFGITIAFCLCNSISEEDEEML